MDIHQFKQRIDASGKKLATLGNEFIKSKDEIAARKVLVKMFGEMSLNRHCCWVNRTLRWIEIKEYEDDLR